MDIKTLCSQQTIYFILIRKANEPYNPSFFVKGAADEDRSAGSWFSGRKMVNFLHCHTSSNLKIKSKNKKKCDLPRFLSVASYDAPIFFNVHPTKWTLFFQILPFLPMFLNYWSTDCKAWQIFIFTQITCPHKNPEKVL